MIEVDEVADQPRERSAEGGASPGHSTRPSRTSAPKIDIVKKWIPVDPARSIEATAIAVFFVFGWLLALWVYVKLSH